MSDDPVAQQPSLLETVIDQFDILLSVLSRPAVQYQVLAISLIILLAWLLPRFIWRWWRRRYPVAEAPLSGSGQEGWTMGIYKLIAPILSLILLYLTIAVFGLLGHPNGLLDKLTLMVWTWLFYRIIVTLLYIRYGDSVRPYQNRILTPIFLLVILWEMLTLLPFSGIANATIGFGTVSITLGSMMTAVVVLYLFYIAAWIVERLTATSLPSRLDAEPGLIDSVATLVRYAIISIGILASMVILGLDLTSLAIVAGGLSVGIGIGLQDIVANFISGLILLFEQSLRRGDIIELNGRISTVESVGLRATTVRSLKNEELIIPNNTFTTEQVTNLTRSDKLVRVLVPFGVSYDSDPIEIRRIAIETGLQHEAVLTEPPALVLFRGYGDSSLDFDLVVCINQPERINLIKSDLYYMLWEAFAAMDIEIPFPQRDLNLGDGWEQLASSNR